MKPLFQCLASEEVTEEWLEDMARFRVQDQTYRFGQDDISIVTRYATGTIMGSVYLYRYHHIPDTIPFQAKPTALVVMDIPKELQDEEYMRLLTLSQTCQDQNIFIVYLSQPEKESRDEVYLRLFSWLIQSCSRV